MLSIRMLQRFSYLALELVFTFLLFAAFCKVCGASFVDSEKLHNTVVTTAILKVSIDSDVKTSLMQTTSQTSSIRIINSGTLPIQQKITELHTSPGCTHEMLYYIDGSYTKPLASLPLVVLVPKSGRILTIRLEAESLRNVPITCEINFTLMSWQTNFAAPTKGFVDKKKIFMSINYIPPIEQKMDVELEIHNSLMSPAPTLNSPGDETQDQSQSEPTQPEALEPPAVVTLPSPQPESIISGITQETPSPLPILKQDSSIPEGISAEPEKPEQEETDPPGVQEVVGTPNINSTSSKVELNLQTESSTATPQSPKESTESRMPPTENPQPELDVHKDEPVLPASQDDIQTESPL